MVSCGRGNMCDGNAFQSSAMNVRNKVSCGTFAAAFILQCLEAIEAQKLELV